MSSTSSSKGSPSRRGKMSARAWNLYTANFRTSEERRARHPPHAAATTTGAFDQRQENVGQGCVGPEPRHQAVAAIASCPIATPAVDANDVQGKLAEREPFRIALFHRRQRLAGQPGEGMNLFPQCERLSRAGTVFQSVPVALRSAATRPMHPTDLRPPHGWRAAL